MVEVREAMSILGRLNQWLWESSGQIVAGMEVIFCCNQGLKGIDNPCENHCSQ